jgi:chorismate synthase
MRWLTAGESHGQALSAIVEGIPASVSITTADIDFHLQRRRLGVGRGARQNFEADKVTILGGVRLGLTQGGPIAIQIANSEWPKWEKVMSADPVPNEEIKDLARNAPLTRPRPGHADLVGMQKYNFSDARPILERASARETAARVALGAVARVPSKELSRCHVVGIACMVGILVLALDLMTLGTRPIIAHTALPCRAQKPTAVGCGASAYKLPALNEVASGHGVYEKIFVPFQML